MRDHFVTGVALSLIFMLLHIRTTLADECFGNCFGLYSCGSDLCSCPGPSYESDCPYPCYFDSSSCDNSSSSSDGLSTGAIVGIVAAAIFVLIAAVAGATAYMIARRNKTSPNHSKQTIASAGTTTTTTSPTTIEVQLPSPIPVATASPEQKSDCDSDDKPYQG